MRQTFWSGLVVSLALSTGVWAQPQTDLPEASQVAPADVQAPAETPGAASATRRVENFTIEGNTLLEPELLERTVAPYKGRDLTLPEIKECAKALTTLYQMRGYYLVKAIVPVQDFKTTTVRLLVTEGKLGELKVEGNNAYSTQYLKDYFQGSFGEDGNFRSDLFTRTTMLLNEQPDLNLKATLMPGSKPGTTDIILKAKEDNQFHVAMDYNNYGTSASGQHRAGVSLEYTSMLFEGDQLLARGVLGFPSKENLFTQIQYQAPLDMDGTGINLSYSNGAFAVSQGLGAILDVRGSADIYTIGFSKALDRELDFSSNVGLSFSHKDVRNDLFGGLLPFSRDTYSTGRLTYQCQWRAPENMTFLNATATFGLGQSGTPSSRLGASPGSRFNLNLARIQHITPELNLVLLGAGQYATNPLFVAEQYAIGGPDTVRGFQQAQLLGDNAYQASAELRYSPIEGEPDLFQLVFFLDHGGVSLKRPQPGDLPFGSSLTGTGFGFRYAITPGSNLRVDLGFPLTPVQGNSSPVIYTGLQTKF